MPDAGSTSSQPARSEYTASSVADGASSTARLHVGEVPETSRRRPSRARRRPALVVFTGSAASESARARARQGTGRRMRNA
jgi:hypothetical protein